MAVGMEAGGAEEGEEAKGFVGGGKGEGFDGGVEEGKVVVGG